MRFNFTVVVLGVALAALPWRATAAAPDAVSGQVFLDANGNGVADRGEQGLPDVRVTDGVNFVKTDGEGRYSITIARDPTIPVRAAQTISVCWPTGTWPSSPWWFRLSRVTNAVAVHFALRPDRQPLPFCYLHMTDAHESFNAGAPEFAGFVNALPEDLKFVLDTGDSYRPKSAEAPFRRLFLSTVGNHDMSEAAHPPPEGRFGVWTARLGPLRWSFDVAGIHFIGVDVTEDFKSDAMIDWLEKDLAAVPRLARIILNYHYPDLWNNERFSRLLQDPRIELVQAGHNHAYMWFAGGPKPMVTAYHWQPPGTCNIGIVSTNGIAIGVYCIGCKKSLGRHSRRCPTQWVDHVLVTGIRTNFAELHTMPDGPLAGRPSIRVTEPYVLLKAELDPQGAKRTAIRFGRGEGVPEVAYTGDRLVVGDVAVPFPVGPAQQTLKLTIFAHRDLLTVWANGCFFMERRVKLEQVGEVGLTSDGAAIVKSLTLQEVRADPANRSFVYACACAHGAVRRNPEPL